MGDIWMTMNDVTAQFSIAFSVSLKRFSDIYSFRQVAEIGLETASGRILEDALHTVHDLFTNPDSDKYFLDKKAALEAMGGIETVATDQAIQQLRLFQKSIDAASLVFAHSILDGVAYEFCRIVAQLDPSHFGNRLGERKVALKDIKEASYDAVLSTKIEGYLEQLEKESLLAKTDLLHAVCQPDSDFSPIKDFEFDRDRLQELDRLRHGVVHDQIEVDPLPNGDDDLWFLRSNANYLMALLNMRFDLKIDPMKGAEAFGRNP